MKRIAVLAGALLSSAAFAGSEAPLRAHLMGHEEVPAVNSLAEAEFEARIAHDGQSVDYTMTYSGLQAPVLMSHIHFAQKGVNGPIIVWLCGTSTNPGPAGTQVCPGRSGTISGTFTAANVLASPATQQLAAGDLESLIDAIRDGVAYVNMHSSVSPGGEMRGQITVRGDSGR